MESISQFKLFKSIKLFYLITEKKIVWQVSYRDLLRRSRVFPEAHPKLGVHVLLPCVLHGTSGRIAADFGAGSMGS